MALEPQDAAKQVFIAYRQLEAMTKETIHYGNATVYGQTYNRALETLKQCFSIDVAFSNSIKHLQPLNQDAKPQELAAYARTLLATAHSFIELYLSPEDKKKAIGFHA